MLKKFEFNKFAVSNNIVEHLENYHFKWPKLNELDNLRLSVQQLQWQLGKQFSKFDKCTYTRYKHTTFYIIVIT